MKRKARRSDWRTEPAKRMIGADFSIQFRIRLSDAMASSRILCGVPVSKDELDRIGKTIMDSVSLHYSAAVLGRARMHRLVADDSPRLSSDVLLAHSKFLFREAGVKVEE